MLSAAYLRNNAACFFRQEFFHELFVLNSDSPCFNIFCSNGRLASMFSQDKRSGPLWRTTCNELIFVFLFVHIYLCVCVGGTCARLKSVCCFLNFSKTRKTIEKNPDFTQPPLKCPLSCLLLASRGCCSAAILLKAGSKQDGIGCQQFVDQN